METATTDDRLCIECHSKLRGRVDQKFCCDHCRNTFNNRMNSSANKNVRRINAILRKNRRILFEFNPYGKRTIDAVLLAEKGFNFHYYTNLYRTKKGSMYYFCYDQGYIKLDDDQCMLVIKQDYVK